MVSKVTAPGKPAQPFLSQHAGARGCGDREFLAGQPRCGSRFSAARGERGAALVVVLSCLVLVAIVVVAFMAGSATERTSSRSYAEGGRARLLAQSAMDIVQGQIWSATTQSNASWASQPGAIRTFLPGGTNFANVYKLYSSGTMVTDGTFDAGATNAPSDVPADWANRPNQYVDLNMPVVTSAGTNFPILDPRAKDAAAPTNSVAGFDYNSSRGATQTNLPMPVQWMYQLRDGTLAAMSDSGKVAGASTNNPIVGRLAFWTDDDTCKININTAGEGVFWDVPRAYNQAGGSEAALSQYQPAQREYQRYPGHPATLSLRTVFPSLTRTEIYALTPRVQNDATGSNGGTQAPTGPLPLKTQRLYSSLDELLFSTNASGSPLTRIENPPSGTINPTNLSKLGFFLSAYNRAPEINLYGKPRISMWPVNSNPAYRTGIDKWFATCSTIGGYPFYFQRSNPVSATADFDNIPRNQQLFSYLQNLTSSVPPGYTSTFSTKFGADRDQILTTMFDYIRCVNLVDTSDKSPSSTVNIFAMPRPINASALINTGTGHLGFHGLGQVVPIRIGTSRGFGRFPTFSEASIVIFPMYWSTTGKPNPNGNAGEATDPVRQGETAAGAGNVPASTSPMNARMYRAYFLLEPFIPAQGYVQCNQDYKLKITGLDSIGVNGSSIGFPASATVAVQGGTRAMIAGSSLQSNAPLIYSIDGITTVITPADGVGTRPRWPFLSAPFAMPSGQFSVMNTVLSGNNTNQQDAPPDFVLNGGNAIQVEVQNRNGDVVQTLSFEFPNAARLPTPTAPAMGGNPFTANSKTGVTVHQGFRERIQWATQDSSGGTNGKPIPDSDTVISVEPAGAYSDLRLVALLADNLTPPIKIFEPNKKVASASLSGGDNKGVSFRTGFNSTMTNLDAYGNLVEDLQTPVQADVASFINGVKNVNGDPGDWDAGLGNSRDGPYINKPDEGDFRKSGTPYFSIGGFENSSQLGFDTFFAPNRQVPSPGMFGSLPSRAKAGGGWETLLFNPNPAAGDRHRGFGQLLPNGSIAPNGQNPPDYLFLDLFNMPVIEPYAISEPFSTAGKINLNYQIVPFTYINRDTGLRALFAATRVSAVHDSFAPTYKTITAGKSIRHAINADETLKQFQDRFLNNRIFMSASEICGVDLYPVVTAANRASGAADQPTYSASRAGIKAWWSTRKLTGDNVREQPYTTLYQNLTTQSNTYTIHVWAQAIQKSPSTPPDEMASRDQISGEHRVAYAIERFIDPKNPALPDFSLSSSPTATQFYQFRVNNTKQFLP